MDMVVNKSVSFYIPGGYIVENKLKSIQKCCVKQIGIM